VNKAPPSGLWEAQSLPPCASISLQLAGEAGVDRTFVNLFEAGKRQPTLSVICALARAVGEKPWDLVEATCRIAGMSGAETPN